MNNNKCWIVGALLGSLMLPVSAVADDTECERVSGRVRLDPDPVCHIVGTDPAGPVFLGPPNCFTVQVRGDLRGSGYSGLTTEQPAGTPTVLFEPGVAPVPGGAVGETRQILTARSHLILQGGEVRSADVVVVGADAVTEQLLITAGSGAYAGVTGNVTVLGNSIQQWARYRGVLCGGD